MCIWFGPLKKKKYFKDSLQNNQLPLSGACIYSPGFLSDQQQHRYSWSDSQENTIAYLSESSPLTIWDSMKFQVYFSSWSHILWGFINLAVLQEVITIMSNVTFSYQNLPSLLFIPNISPCFRGIVLSTEELNEALWDSVPVGESQPSPVSLVLSPDFDEMATHCMYPLEQIKGITGKCFSLYFQEQGDGQRSLPLSFP